MGEHVATGLEKWLLDKTGKDIYFWNFLILMFFTLFEVGAVFFEEIPGTEIEITRLMVWAILIGVGIIKGYGIAAGINVATSYLSKSEAVTTEPSATP